VSRLLLLCFSSCHVNRSQLFFHLEVINHLEASVVLSLHGPQAFLLLGHLALHLGFLALQVLLVFNLIDLVLAQSLEVVWLESVVCKHRLCCVELLSHEVVVVCVLLLVLAPPCEVLLFFVLAVALFLGELQVCVTGRIAQGLASSFVLRLLIFK